MLDRSFAIHDIGGGCCHEDWAKYHGVKLSSRFRTPSLRTAPLAALRRRKQPLLLVLAQHHGTTYHHVMNDVIPRLIYSVPLLHAVPALKVLVPPGDLASAFVSVFGLPKSRVIVQSSKDSPLYCALCIFPPPFLQFRHSYPANQTSVTAALLSDLVLPASSKPTVTSKVVVIRRASDDAGENGCEKTRCLSNFNAFQSALGALYSVQVFAPDTPLTDTIRAFAGASAVVAVHGAGLQNIMFCRPGTQVIELGFGAGLYAAISRSLQLKYRHVELPDFVWGSSNYTLRDVDGLVTNVSNILDESGIERVKLMD